MSSEGFRNAMNRAETWARIGRSDLEPLRIQYHTTPWSPVSGASLERNRIGAGLRDPDVVSAYKLLRTQVLQRCQARDWRCIGVTSPEAGEGKSLTAANLAIAIAEEPNHTAILVDLDFRSPEIHDYFELSQDVGLSEYLANGGTLADSMVCPGIEGLVLLPTLQPLPQSSEMYSHPRFVALMAELRSRYVNRIVVCDLPSVLDSDDVLAVSPHLDAVIMVVSDGRTDKRALSSALDRVENVPLAGTVLNRVRN